MLDAVCTWIRDRSFFKGAGGRIASLGGVQKKWTSLKGGPRRNGQVTVYAFDTESVF